MKFNPHKYDIKVKRIFVDGEFFYESTVSEFIHVSDFHDTYQGAYDLMIDTLRMTKGLFDYHNFDFPKASKS